jgi:MFS transporter, DHA2 family, methylenomycin A resistance protein
MSLGFGVVQLDVTIVNTALSSIGRSLGGGVSELQWIVSAYTIAFAALILTAGALGDRVGAKKILMLGFALFTLASAACAACALAPSSALLIASRAIQRVGAAILVPNSLALLNHAYRDEKQRGRAVGIWAAGASFALTAGPLAGGGLIALVGWRSISLVNLPSVEKSRSGVAAGVLNSTRQTGSVIGVALFGSLLEHEDAFMRGVHMSLVISTLLFVIAAAVAFLGAHSAK